AGVGRVGDEADGGVPEGEISSTRVQAPEMGLVTVVVEFAGFEFGIRARASQVSGVARFAGAQHNVARATAIVASAGEPPTIIQVVARWAFTNHQRVTRAVLDVGKANLTAPVNHAVHVAGRRWTGPRPIAAEPANPQVGGEGNRHAIDVRGHEGPE